MVLSRPILGVLCFIAFIGQSSGQSLVIDHLVIDADTNNVVVCFTGPDLADYDVYRLDIQSMIPDPITDIGLTLKAPTGDSTKYAECKKSSCLSTENIDKIKTGETDWVLHIEDAGDKSKADPLEAKAHIKLSGDLPTTLTKKIDVIGMDKNRILRFQEEFSLMYFNNDDTRLDPCSSPPCYYKFEIPKATPAFAFANCLKEAGSAVPVCGSPVAENEVNKDDGFDPVIVAVDYDSTTTTITGKLAVQDGIYDDLSTCGGTNCKVDDYDITIVNYDEKQLKLVTVQDRELVADPLIAGTVEVQWKKLGVQYFRMTLSNPGSGEDTIYHEVNLDCTMVDGDLCTGYFIDVPATSHDITIQEIGDWTNIESTIGANSWTNKVTPTALSLTKESQKIHVEITTTNLGEQKTETNVCFKYVEDTFVQGTQYEFLAINKSGLWKKSLDAKKKDESHACFHTLDVVTDDFDEGSKFLVLLRDTENGKVLASGEASSNLHALRAIKPEVDNGSSGSSSTLTIVGAAIAGIACLMALVAVAVMFVMKINKGKDGLQYPLHRTNIQDSTIMHGLDNPIPIM